MNLKIFNNKRALSEFILDLWSYLVFIVTIFLFFVVFYLYSLNVAERELKGIKDIPAYSAILINYLKTPVLVGGNEFNTAELIRLWNNNPDKYNEILNKALQNILNNLEYEYVDQQTTNTIMKGFQIAIYQQKIKDTLSNQLLELSSASFDKEMCVSHQATGEKFLPDCVDLAEQFVPISENSGFYVVLRESNKLK